MVAASLIAREAEIGVLPALPKESKTFVGEQIQSPRHRSLCGVGEGRSQQPLTCRSVRARG